MSGTRSQIYHRLDYLQACAVENVQPSVFLSLAEVTITYSNSFPFAVMPAVPSCTEGEYLPLFVEPTPEHGAHLNFTAGVQQHINIQAEANETT